MLAEKSWTQPIFRPLIERALSAHAQANDADATPCSGLRTILVPPDIIPVKRQSPLPLRKRTPWRPQREGEVITTRTGGREWFSDKLFVESQQDHPRVGYSASCAFHIGCAIFLLTATVLRPVPILRAAAGSMLVMPARLANVPVFASALPASRPVDSSVSNTAPRPPAAAPPAGAHATAAAPVVAPSAIEPESGLEPGDVAGIEGGVPGGIPGGVPGGLIEGDPLAEAAAVGPLRVGAGVKAPRKIKDVKPIYPAGALADQVHGLVIIEATIGIDGKVKDARVLRSIPLLDRAALDAVRQWEYVPTIVNGAPVSVIMTVIVSFALQ